MKKIKIFLILVMFPCSFLVSENLFAAACCGPLGECKADLIPCTNLTKRNAKGMEDVNESIDSTERAIAKAVNDQTREQTKALFDMYTIAKNDNITASINASGVQLSQNFRALAQVIKETMSAQSKTRAAQDEILNSSEKAREQLVKAFWVKKETEKTPVLTMAAKNSDSKFQDKRNQIILSQSSAINLNYSKGVNNNLSRVANLIKKDQAPSTPEYFTSDNHLGLTDAETADAQRYIEHMMAISSNYAQKTMLNEDENIVLMQDIERRKVAAENLATILAMRSGYEADDNILPSKMEVHALRIEKRSKDSKWYTEQTVLPENLVLARANKVAANIEDLLLEVLLSKQRFLKALSFYSIKE